MFGAPPREPSHWTDSVSERKDRRDVKRATEKKPTPKQQNKSAQPPKPKSIPKPEKQKKSGPTQNSTPELTAALPEVPKVKSSKQSLSAINPDPPKQTSSSAGPTNIAKSTASSSAKLFTKLDAELESARASSRLVHADPTSTNQQLGASEAKVVNAARRKVLARAAASEKSETYDRTATAAPESTATGKRPEVSSKSDNQGVLKAASSPSKGPNHRTIATTKRTGNHPSGKLEDRSKGASHRQAPAVVVFRDRAGEPSKADGEAAKSAFVGTHRSSVPGPTSGSNPPWDLMPEDEFAAAIASEEFLAEYTHKLGQICSYSAPPSSMTSSDELSVASLTPEGRGEGHKRKGSWNTWPQGSYTPPERNPGGEILRYGNPTVEVDEEWQERIVNTVLAMRDDKWGVLMLLERQGGTFGYGKKFTVEDGSEVRIDNAADARKPENTRWKTKHLLYYGDNIDYIGTKGCITCLGVYFAITGNRVFCAHFNVWTKHKRSLEGVERLHPITTPKLYTEVLVATKQKLLRHAKEYGWTAADVEQDTIKFVSSNSPYVAHVVATGVLEALEIDPDVFFAKRVTKVDKAIGFIITPGSAYYTKPGGMCMWFRRIDTYKGGVIKPQFNAMPAVYHQRYYVDDDNTPWGDWHYTAGIGMNGRWLPNLPILVELRRGKIRRRSDAGSHPLD